MSDLSEAEGLESVARSKKSLRRKIETNFEEMVSFQIAGKKLMMYSSDVNLYSYVAATLKGCGLRDDDLTRAFPKIVRKKIPPKKTEMTTLSRGVNRKSKYYRTIPTHL